MDNFVTKYPTHIIIGTMALAFTGFIYNDLSSRRVEGVQTHHAQPAAVSSQNSGCPDSANIQSLFSAYDGLAKIVVEGSVSTPSIDGLRGWGNQERQAAANLHDYCEVEAYHTLAQVHALSAIRAITAAREQQLGVYRPANY